MLVSKMNRHPMMLVLSGIDGALANRHTHSLAQSQDAIRLLAEMGIPLIMCSSNTRAEIEAIRRACPDRHPFISENGSALFVPIGYFAEAPRNARHVGGYHVYEFGHPYAHVVLTLHVLARRLGVELVAFGDLSIDEIANVQQIPLHRAQLAKQREYDEPFRIASPEPQSSSRLLRALLGANLHCIRGDRVQHVNGVADRGAAMETLRELYERAYGCPVLTVGLGSRMCDLPLLRQVDLPIIVRSEADDAASTLFRKVPLAKITGTAGPSGWSQAVVDVVTIIEHMRKSA